jgi:hypothetical protein
LTLGEVLRIFPRSVFPFFFAFYRPKEEKVVDYTNLRTVKQLAQEAPFTTESTIRWWIYQAARNGFAATLIKIGGRIYIDKTAFNKWLEDQRMASLPGEPA